MSTTNTITKVVAATPHSSVYSAILARLIDAKWGWYYTEEELHKHLSEISQEGAFSGVSGFVWDDELAEFFNEHLSDKEALICELQDEDENFSTDVWGHNSLVRAVLFAELGEVRTNSRAIVISKLQKRMKARVVLLLLERVVEEYMLACEKE